jgi:hypothetical protein
MDEGNGGNDGKASPPQNGSATTASGRESTTSGRDVPNPPDPVPIGDHLHWLAVAGLLWGAWRIARRG